VTSQDLSLHLLLSFRTLLLLMLMLFDWGRREDLTMTEEDDGRGSFGEDKETRRLAASVTSMEDLF